MDAWSFTYYDLGIETEEWLEMTPRHIQALSKRHLDKMRWQEWQSSNIAASTVNSGFCRPEKSIPPDYFMLHPLPKPKQEPKRISGEAIRQLVRGLPTAFVHSS